MSVLSRANLKEVELRRAYLKEANFADAHLEGADLANTHLAGANIQEAFFDGLTRLNESNWGDREHGVICLADVHWGDVNLAFVNWSEISFLGDEIQAMRRLKNASRYKVRYERFLEYQTAARAYRQLSVVLRNSGLNEDAARFAYRAQRMQREAFRISYKRGKFLFSFFLDLLTGYGYKPLRCFIAYLYVIFIFAFTYSILGQIVGPALSPLGSLVFSVTSFHGRGFFPGGIKLDDPLTVIAAIQAFIGLLIEVTFIATLTQRLFSR